MKIVLANNCTKEEFEIAKPKIETAIKNGYKKFTISFSSKAIDFEVFELPDGFAFDKHNITQEYIITDNNNNG